VAVALLVGVPADAAGRPSARAAATVVQCGGDSVAVAARVQGRRIPHGATLRVRYQLAPLVGDLRSGEERDLGARRSATGSEAFSGLPANMWIGIVRYRWVRGAKTVLSGVRRTARTRVGRRAGSAFCVLPVGQPRRDTEAPAVALVSPRSDAWLRAPVEVRLAASDDLSGVAAVGYAVDGGPVQTGRSFTLDTDGAHTVTYWARDAAGNESPHEQALIRVDASAPSAPVVTAPAGGSTTGDTTPTVVWSQASDAASGVQGYAVVVTEPGGSIVASATVPASQTSLTLDPLPDGAYTVRVTAADGASPDPHTTTSDPLSFTVDYIVYANGFESCGDYVFTRSNTDAAQAWSCSPDYLTTSGGQRCNADVVYYATSPPIDVAPSGAFTVSWLYDFRQSDPQDIARIEYSTDNGGSWSLLRQYASQAGGNDGGTLTVPSGRRLTLRFSHELDGKGILGGGCAADADAAFSIDNLVITRK
jgi:hypothetical protein